jgi:hypothetical protein
MACGFQSSPLPLIALIIDFKFSSKWSGGAGGPGHRSFPIQTGVGVCRSQGEFRALEQREDRQNDRDELCPILCPAPTRMEAHG